MRSGDLLNDGEADAGSRSVACLCAAVEAVENPRLVLFWNGRIRIVHRNLDGAIALCMNVDGGRWWGVFQSIVKQLTKGESEQLAIRIDGQGLRHSVEDLVTV